jgi:hypothetical protein
VAFVGQRGFLRPIFNDGREEFLGGKGPMSTRDDEEAAMEQNTGVRKKLDMTKCCMPLPNLTKPGDVDATYYGNWAREYSCLI